MEEREHTWFSSMANMTATLVLKRLAPSNGEVIGSELISWVLFPLPPPPSLSLSLNVLQSFQIAGEIGGKQVFILCYVLNWAQEEIPSCS